MAVGGRWRAKADINMTPLIDVLLVLLIIFMVITPLTPHGLEALVPQPPPPNAPPPNPNQDRTVVIIIDKDKKMDIQQRADHRSNAWAAARRDLQDPRRTRRVCKGRSGSRIPVVARAIDIAKGAGIDKIGLMTPKVEAGQ